MVIEGGKKMTLNIYKATDNHSQYFKKEVLEKGVGYIVSDQNSICGMFSFMISNQLATLNFPYCINKEAIRLAIKTFLEEYPEIIEIKSLSKQNLKDLGFKNNIYKV